MGNDLRVKVKSANLKRFKAVISEDNFEQSREILLRKLNSGVHASFGPQREGVDFKSLVIDILKEHQLPRNFFQVIAKYVMGFGIDEGLIPEQNYTIEINPSFAILDFENKPTTRTWAISLVLYSRLTTAEMKAAMNDMRLFQDALFFNVDMDDDDESIERLAEQRSRGKTVEEFKGCYLSIVHQQYLNGNIDEAKFKALKKLHANTIERVKHGKFTAKDIANKAKTKGRKLTAASVRTKISRRKKKRKTGSDNLYKRFGGNK